MRATVPDVDKYAPRIAEAVGALLVAAGFGLLLGWWATLVLVGLALFVVGYLESSDE